MQIDNMIKTERMNIYMCFKTSLECCVILNASSMLNIVGAMQQKALVHLVSLRMDTSSDSSSDLFAEITLNNRIQS